MLDTHLASQHHRPRVWYVSKLVSFLPFVFRGFACDKIYIKTQNAKKILLLITNIIVNIIISIICFITVFISSKSVFYHFHYHYYYYIYIFTFGIHLKRYHEVISNIFLPHHCCNLDSVLIGNKTVHPLLLRAYLSMH